MSSSNVSLFPSPSLGPKYNIEPDEIVFVFLDEENSFLLD